MLLLSADPPTSGRKNDLRVVEVGGDGVQDGTLVVLLAQLRRGDVVRLDCAAVFLLQFFEFKTHDLQALGDGLPVLGNQVGVGLGASEIGFGGCGAEELDGRLDEAAVVDVDHGESPVFARLDFSDDDLGVTIDEVLHGVVNRLAHGVGIVVGDLHNGFEHDQRGSDSPLKVLVCKTDTAELAEEHDRLAQAHGIATSRRRTRRLGEHDRVALNAAGRTSNVGLDTKAISLKRGADAIRESSLRDIADVLVDVEVLCACYEGIRSVAVNATVHGRASVLVHVGHNVRVEGRNQRSDVAGLLLDQFSALTIRVDVPCQFSLEITDAIRVVSVLRVSIGLIANHCKAVAYRGSTRISIFSSRLAVQVALASILPSKASVPSSAAGSLPWIAA